MRCAWCEQEGGAVGGDSGDEYRGLPCCYSPACLGAALDLDMATCALWSPAGLPAGSTSEGWHAVHGARRNAAQRGRREMRGEPVDWTRPVEGWLLW